MNDRIKDYFAFSKKEQRGLIVLLGLMLLTMLINLLLPDLVPETEFDTAAFQQEIEQFLAEAEKADSSGDHKPGNFRDEISYERQPVLSNFQAAPFDFDPNEISGDKWIEMGMDGRIANNIIRYREKGGKFRDKEGFKKIYGMNEEIYRILEPYIRITASDNKIQDNKGYRQQVNYYADHEKKYQEHHKDTVKIELNTADSAALLALTGIGPSYAGRIIKYRDRLGGFYIREQLMELKGMDSIRFNQFKEQITIDTALIRKIDLNTVAFKDLLKHPYFEYYLVKAIFQKKDEIKRFDSVGQLKQIEVMYQELYDKIAPYLEVN